MDMNHYNGSTEVNCKYESSIHEEWLELYLVHGMIHEPILIDTHTPLFHHDHSHLHPHTDDTAVFTLTGNEETR